MQEILFTFGVMFVFILFLIGLKVCARILYLVLFFPVLLSINKILIWRIRQEKLQNKLKEKGENRALHYLLKYFQYAQYVTGCILVIIYAIITAFIFKNFTENYIVMGVISLLYFSYTFTVGRYKYKPSADKDIHEVTIEGMKNIDVKDLLNGIDFDFNIDI